MIPSQGAAQSDSYLLQQISSATPEQLCVMLLEGAQRFLQQAVAAIKAHNIEERARMVNRVSAIIEELMLQVDNNSENELAVNLIRIYEWWMNQLFDASKNNRYETLEKIHSQMNEMKITWAQVAQRGQAGASPAMSLGGELMG
ncbi:MAG: flagellar export chaperone FliS [Holophagales bacterium]|jgi:flagellar protein FliS|nr:flagellar export chaperone FliS [Holophagales bacterium]